MNELESMKQVDDSYLLVLKYNVTAIGSVSAAHLIWLGKGVMVTLGGYHLVQWNFQ